MSRRARTGGLGCVAAALIGAVLVPGCGDPLDKGPGPRPIGSIAPAAAHAESAGTDPVPQRHRGKLPAVIDEEPGGEEEDSPSGPMVPPSHISPPGGSTL